ncbi:MAG: hypothetical protein HPY81_09305 [Firmicutes bacterium]|nr:hypothetical protein [Bacillota bacterium]
MDSIIFSFQGATKEQYEIMRNNSKYNVLVDNILKLIDTRGKLKKPYVHISTTLTDETEEEVKNFVDYWVGIVDSVGIGKTNLSRLNFHLIKSLDVAKRLFELKEKETIRKIYRECTEVYQKLSVDWDGKVSCCCSDYDNFLTVGDANEQTLYEIWNNSPDLRLYRELLDKYKHRSLALCCTCYHTYEEF